MIRLRHLAKDSVIYGLTSAARSLVGVLLVPIYTRVFATGDYGVIDTLTTLIAFLTLILTLGMDTSVALFYYDTQQEHERGVMLSTALVTRLLLSTLAALLITGMAPLISQTFFGTASLANAIVLAVWSAPVNALVGFLLELLRLKRNAWHYSALAVSNLLLGVLFSILFVVYWRWGVYGSFAGPLLASVIVLPAAAMASWQLFRPRLSRRWLNELLKVGLPLVPAAFGGWLIAYANRYFLLYYGSSADVGLLAVGNKASAPVALLTSAFLIAWGPFAFSLQNQANANEIVAKTLTYFLTLGGVLTVTVGIFTRELLIIFTTPPYYAGHVAGGLMIFQLLADASYYIVSLGLLLSKQTKVLAYSTPIVATTNLLLNWLLTPRFGFVGAAVTGFLSYAFSATLVYHLAQRRHPIPYESFKVLRLIAWTLACWIAGISLTMDSIWVAVGLKLLVIAGFLIGLFALRIMDGREVNLLIHRLRRRYLG